MKEEAVFRLSKRLTCITQAARKAAGTFPEKPFLADIGCDHALVPLTLLQEGTIAFAIACDVKEGPLEAAKENAIRFGLENNMRFVLADGLDAIENGQAQICVISGMGGELIRSILEQGDPDQNGVQVLVLSPNTKWEILRDYLERSAYGITDERMVEEDDKFYPVITVHAGAQTKEDEGPLCRMYGPVLLKEKDQVLYTFLQRQEARLLRIMEQVEDHPDEKIKTEEALRLNHLALQRFEEG